MRIEQQLAEKKAALQPNEGVDDFMICSVINKSNQDMKRIRVFCDYTGDDSESEAVEEPFNANDTMGLVVPVGRDGQNKWQVEWTDKDDQVWESALVLCDVLPEDWENPDAEIEMPIYGQSEGFSIIKPKSDPCKNIPVSRKG